MDRIRNMSTWNGTPCTSIQTKKTDQSQERAVDTKNMHCCDDHADESCTISMAKEINKTPYFDNPQLTCYPSGLTLLKDRDCQCRETGKRQFNDSGLIKLFIQLGVRSPCSTVAIVHHVSDPPIAAVRSDPFQVQRTLVIDSDAS